MKYLKIVFYAVWLLILAIMQPTLGRGIEVFSVAPNFFLCFVVIIALFRGKKEGGIVGLIFGLVYDMLIGRLVGVNALIYFYLGFGSGILGEHFFSGEKRLAGMGTIAIATVLSAFVYYIAQTVSGIDTAFSVMVIRIGLIEAVYNAVIGLIMIFPVTGTMKLTRMKRIF